MIGSYFVEQILKTPVITDPWSYQIINDSIPLNFFNRLQEQTHPLLNLDLENKLKLIAPDEFKDYGIDAYDEVYEMAESILKNEKKLSKDLYPDARRYSSVTVYAHLSITPPLPYKFPIHEEGLEKYWSCVTYITPDQNVGTKIYKTKNEDSFVKEAPWQPNSTFVFCGKKGVTWHSYESNQSVNRITLNFFLMSDERGKRFI